MSMFVPRWSRWSTARVLHTEEIGTDSSPEHEVATCKTSKTISAGSAGCQGPSSEKNRLTEEAVASMTLDEFAQAGLIVEVHSELLNADLLFVSDNVSKQAVLNSDSPVYRAAELRRLAVMNPQPHTLRWIHEAKKVFDGVICDVR